MTMAHVAELVEDMTSGPEHFVNLPFYHPFMKVSELGTDTVYILSKNTGFLNCLKDEIQARELKLSPQN